MAYELPPLPYDYAALEPHIDEATMKLHHDKHHQAYVTNLNGAVEKHPDLGKKSPEELIKDLTAIPEDVRKVVQNNGGGHVNHTMFWQIMKPKGGGEPSGDIAAQIKADFGDFESFKKLFNETTAKQFGSGWGWLIFKGGKLTIVTTANQDNPISQGSYPILGNDVWEHAYYLKYQNRAPTTSPPGGTPSTGTKSTSASPPPRATSNIKQSSNDKGRSDSPSATLRPGFRCNVFRVTPESFLIFSNRPNTLYPFGPIGSDDGPHCGEALCVPLHDPVQFDPPPPVAPPTTNCFQS